MNHTDHMFTQKIKREIILGKNENDVIRAIKLVNKCVCVASNSKPRKQKNTDKCRLSSFLLISSAYLCFFGHLRKRFFVIDIGNNDGNVR